MSETHKASTTPAAASPSFDSLHARPSRTAAWAGWLTAALVLGVYLWLSTAGTWTGWPDTGSFHQKLADAFRRGQTHLVDAPDARLLALPDPYDPSANEAFRLHDASLYEGRYYLYWGPVPAGLLAAGGDMLGVRDVKDSVLVFTFTALTLVLVTGLLVHLRRRYFADVPAWTVALAVLAVGLANPFPYNLGRAAVYEVAISAAAMFLTGGILFAFLALDPRRRQPDGGGQPSRAWLLAAGVCLACAVGSRTSAGPAATVVAAVVAYRAWRTAPDDGKRAGRRALAAAIPTFLPLALAGVGLAIYNAARFGSPFESGIRYQLAGYYGGASYAKLTSAANVVPNLYSYLLRPADFDNVFPFVYARSGLDAGAFPASLRPPTFHMARESTVGVLRASPLVWFAVIPLVGLMRRRRPATGDNDADADDDDDARWPVVLLGAAAALGAVPALVVSLSSNRYQADWMLPLLVLSVIGFWTGYRTMARRRVARRLWLALGAASACATAIVGCLLPVTAGAGHFAVNNPSLFKRLIESTYLGDAPAVARVSAPFGIDPADDGRGYWLGRDWARVDVMTPRDGNYRLEMTAALGPCLAGADSAQLGFASSPREPFDDAVMIHGFVNVPRRPEGFTLGARMPLRAGFSRVYLFTKDLPTHSDGPELQGCRRMLSITGLKLEAIDPAPSPG